jgi:RNA polymerase sigma-70 factor (ECF subfamily)
MEPERQSVVQAIEALYREESGRVLATLVRLLGDLDLAEESMHAAFAIALEQWPREGIPARPRPWLISTARFKAIDTIRRRARSNASQDAIAAHLESLSTEHSDDGWNDDPRISDDQLRLIFTCCHPSLPLEGRVALTLRHVCGIATEQIAAAFLVPTPTLAQRIVRAKSRIRESRIPFEVPAADQLPERLDAVLTVIYLIYNEGYSSPASATLATEAIRLGRLLVQLMPDAESIGLLALMLLQESRRASRTDVNGDVILLEHQDRSLWNRAAIDEAVSLVDRALASDPPGPFTLQAAIAAVHASTPLFAATDWNRIVALYQQLAEVNPSPVVRLNLAVALAERDGPEAGLAMVESLLDQYHLSRYHLAHATRAELLRRLERRLEARSAYLAALALAHNDSDRRFLQSRIDELG